MNSLQLGSLGVSVVLIVIDTDTGLPLNVSTATVKTIRITDPTGISIDYSASFVTDGSDGEIAVITEVGVFELNQIWNMANSGIYHDGW